MSGFITGKEVEVPDDVQNILKFDEKILHGFQQAGIGGKISGLESIFVTDRRVIKVRPKTFGMRSEISDYLYQDMANIKLNKGMLRSSIAIQMRFMSEDVSIENIPKDATNNIFKTIQNGIAGRMNSGQTQSHEGNASTAHIDVAEQIKKLAELKNEGILTEEEFQTKKEHLLKL